MPERLQGVPDAPGGAVAGPTALDTARSSRTGTPYAAAASATPKPSIASAAAPGWRSASSAARRALPVTVETVRTGATAHGTPPAARAAATRPVSAPGTGWTDRPKPSSSTARYPSGVSAPRSAATIAEETTRDPGGAAGWNPPAIPAETTRS